MSNSTMLKLGLIIGATAIATVMNELLQNEQPKKGENKSPHDAAVDAAMSSVADATITAANNVVPSMATTAIQELTDSAQRVTDTLSKRQQELLDTMRQTTGFANLSDEGSAEVKPLYTSSPVSAYPSTTTLNDSETDVTEDVVEGDIGEDVLVDEDIDVEAGPEDLLVESDVDDDAAANQREADALLQPQVFSRPFATVTVYPLIDEIPRAMLHTPSCVVNLLPDSEARGMMDRVSQVTQQNINAKSGFGVWMIPDISTLIGASFIRASSTATTLAADVFVVKFHTSVLQNMDATQFQRELTELCREVTTPYVSDEEIRLRFISAVAGNAMSVL